MRKKRRLNGTSKVNRQTDKQTHRQTDKQTFQLRESIGPEGRCFENPKALCIQLMEEKITKYNYF